MDELMIDGKVYLSSKRAAKVSGYAKDYIGQLCREGRVEAKLVGRSWYVYEPSLTEHRFNDERSKGKHKPEEILDSKPEVAESPLETAWEVAVYAPEPVETLPSLTETVTEEPKTLSDMQSAWQEWFSSRKVEEGQQISPEPEKHAPAARPVEEIRAYVPEPLPVRMIVSDIAPKYEEKEPVYSRTGQYEEKVAYKKPVRRRASIKGTMSPIIAKALLIALIVFSASVALVATGLIEQTHLGGISDSPIIEFFQGSHVLNK